MSLLAARRGTLGRKHTSYADAVLADNPVAWYRGNGSTADQIGGSSGTLMNGATYGAGILPSASGSQSFSFDGTNDYLTVPDQNALDVSGDFSMEAWIVTNTVAVGVRGILWKDGPAYGMEQADARVTAYLHNGSNYFHASRPSGTVVVQTGTPYHIVGSWAGSVVNCYVNGVLQTGNVETTGSGPRTTTGPLLIGCFSPSSEFFNGRIAEVAIYNHELSSARVSAHYAAGIGA